MIFLLLPLALAQTPAGLYTVKAALAAPEVKKPVLHYADAQKPVAAGPTFKEAVTATAPGTHSVEVEMSFYVCTAEMCNRASEHKTLTLAGK